MIAIPTARGVGLGLLAATALAGCAMLHRPPPAAKPDVYTGPDAAPACPEGQTCNHRQYYDERVARYYYFDRQTGRYYWENGEPRFPDAQRPAPRSP